MSLKKLLLLAILIMGISLAYCGEPIVENDITEIKKECVKQGKKADCKPTSSLENINNAEKRNEHVFNVESEKFYRQWNLHPEFNLIKPYEN